jgi:dipeptidyl-peptidase-4
MRAPIATGILSLALAGTAIAAPTTAEMSARYARAAASSSAPLGSLVLNEKVSPHWVEGGGFWYRHTRADGGELRFVPASGAVRPAFDHARLSAAVSKATGTTVGPWALNVAALTPGRTVELTAGDRVVRCTLANYSCTAAAPAAKDPRQTLSPDGRRAIVVKDHDLWVKDVASGRENPLTSDGETYFAWGKLPDAALLTLASERHPLPLPPWGASWSPDGRYIVASRLDERPIKPYPYLESVPQDGSFKPIARSLRVGVLGEPLPVFSAAVFDTVTGKSMRVALPETFTGSIAFEIFGWSADAKRFYLSLPGKGHDIELDEVNVETGAVRTLVTESPKGFVGLNSLMYSGPNVRLINGGREMLWYSQRSGWGHLYRYDLATGKLLNAVTTGDWLVRDILQVDETRHSILFTASGREPGEPYRRRVYRVDFDGSNLTLLTPEDADHTLGGEAAGIYALFFGVQKEGSPVSPDGATFIDSYSTIATPPVTVLRRTSDGGVVAKLETADISALTAKGWRPPERFVAKAADGKTDLYGVIHWPDPAMGDKVPLIDTLYGGPQMVWGPHNFTSSHNGDAFALTRLGFAVVIVDGRSTPLRSQAFQDVGFANFGDVMVDDHAAVVQQLVARYPRLDGDKVGVTGHSFGGYVSARAMLRHPEVFKVGVSSAGPHVYEAMSDSGSFLPTPDYGDGQRLRPQPNAAPANYIAMDNAPLAANLRGHLMLAYGDLDENAYPAATLQFIDALTKAGRRYDLVYLPNATHRYGGADYFGRRRWDYFTEHLMGVEPPLEPYGPQP